MSDLASTFQGINLTVQPMERFTTLSAQDILSYCAKSDAQARWAAVVCFGLLVLSCAYLGLVRGNGGLRAKLLAYGWVRTVGWLDGLLLPGAAFAAVIVVVRIWMRT
jgi:hypothetical protein